MLHSNFDTEFKEHKIFAELSAYSEFYKSLSFSIFQFVTSGVHVLYNLDSSIISSIQGTVESIKLVLSDGKVNDAYALVRKYHDAVIINTYATLYLKDNCSIENLFVQKIDNWLHNKENLPEYKVMVKYIRNSKALERINNKINLEHYKTIRSRCNDHTHYNFFSYMRLNDNVGFNANRIRALDGLSNDIRDIFVKHFIWLFTLNEHYMMASDYIDCLDCGVIPEEGSQYLVAPYVQEVFDTIVKRHRMDLASELKSVTCMELE